MTVSSSLRQRSPLIVTISVVLALIGGFVSFASVWVDVLWYDQAGFTSVLYTQWIALGIIGVSAFSSCPFRYG